MHDEFACLEFCKSEAECSWITIFSSTGYCQLLMDCPTLDNEICPDCFSGQKEFQLFQLFYYKSLSYTWYFLHWK